MGALIWGLTFSRKKSHTIFKNLSYGWAKHLEYFPPSIFYFHLTCKIRTGIHFSLYETSTRFIYLCGNLQVKSMTKEKKPTLKAIIIGIYCNHPLFLGSQMAFFCRSQLIMFIYWHNLRKKICAEKQDNTSTFLISYSSL